jgi:hypothetical protein
MGKTRKTRKTRPARKRGGGAANTKVNCEAEGFNNSMKQASLGAEYIRPVGHIHLDAERWSFDELVEFTLEGRMVDWYIQQLRGSGIAFTDEDIAKIKNKPELRILGAFYHRYKVVAERLAVARANLNGGVRHFLIPDRFKELKGKNSYKKLLNNSTQKLGAPLRKELDKLVSVVQRGNNFGAVDLPIEEAIDRAQCILFYIVKHKGNLPPGFLMDPRIEERAHTPIIIMDGKSDLESPIIPKKVDSTIAWLLFSKVEGDELKEPPVTFGVF